MGKKKALSSCDSAFLSLKFEVESLMWMGQNLKAIASNIIILQTIQQKTGIHFHRLYAIRRGRPDQGVPL